jgi:AhpD family alkylhydroperoxidase
VLIAVGISVAIDCESCMQWHVEQAAKAGASMREVLEAVEVGMEMGGWTCDGVGAVCVGGDGERLRGTAAVSA